MFIAEKFHVFQRGCERLKRDGVPELTGALALAASALSAGVACSSMLELPRDGAHVGFVTGSLPGKLDWLPQRLLHFFQHRD